MSQEKVDRYKEEKRGRRKKIEKQKKKKLLWKIFGPVLAVLLIAAIASGIYFIPKLTNQYAKENSESEVNYDQLMQMINENAADTEANKSDETEENADSDTTVSTEAESDSEDVSEK